jgi:hypothetical protein
MANQTRLTVGLQEQSLVLKITLSLLFFLSSTITTIPCKHFTGSSFLRLSSYLFSSGNTMEAVQTKAKGDEPSPHNLAQIPAYPLRLHAFAGFSIRAATPASATWHYLLV